jgi:hypothetical protein
MDRRVGCEKSFLLRICEPSPCFFCFSASVAIVLATTSNWCLTALFQGIVAQADALRGHHVRRCRENTHPEGAPPTALRKICSAGKSVAKRGLRLPCSSAHTLFEAELPFSNLYLTRFIRSVLSHILMDGNKE